MLAIFNSLNGHNFSIFQPIMLILVSTFMVHGVFSDKTYLSLGLLSPLTRPMLIIGNKSFGPDDFELTRLAPR